jgi:hypothetical protein
MSDKTKPQDDKAMSPASAGSHGDSLPVLRSLIDGVRGMVLGDPDCGDRIEASDVVRWAVDEIERLRLTDEEREAIARLCEAANDIISDDRTVGGSHWQEDEAAVAVARGLLERLEREH